MIHQPSGIHYIVPPESAYINAPDFHVNRAPQQHKEGVATLFETITQIAYFFYSNIYPCCVHSFYDQLVGRQ
jgi:hypothetical protein